MSVIISPVVSNNRCAFTDTSITEKCNIDLLGCSLQQCINSYNNLVTDYREQQIELDSYKKEYLTLKRKCESKKVCEECAALSHVIAAKDNIIKSVATTLTKLRDLKKASVLKEIFHILHDYGAISEFSMDSINIEDEVKAMNTPNKGAKTSTAISPPQEKSVIDQSASEIEGTPTGRTSPILNTMSKPLDKKKLPSNWHTPESKIVKLNIPKPSKKSKLGGKLKQMRLSVMRAKTTNFVDLSVSSDVTEADAELKHDSIISLQIESMDNDDTILPSPTSGPVELSFKNATKNQSPSKFLKPKEKSPNAVCRLENMENKYPHGTTIQEIDANESINLLQPQRSRIKNQQENIHVKNENDSVVYDVDSSMSLLKRIDQFEKEQKQIIKPTVKNERKLPLYENINVDNVPIEVANNVRVSPMKPENMQKTRKNMDAIKKEKVERVYREPAERRKAEKMKLPGWSCDECKQFYDVLYKDSPEMLMRLMVECSRHRGRQNPARPKTPPGFWQPRWHVEQDTEAFNRQNNAV